MFELQNCLNSFSSDTFSNSELNSDSENSYCGQTIKLTISTKGKASAWGGKHKLTTKILAPEILGVVNIN